MTKTEKIRAYLTENPDAKVSDVVKKFGVTPPYVYHLRKKMKAPAPDKAPAGAMVFTLEDKPQTVDQVLDARAVNYGTFADGARLMQALKRTLSEHAQKHGKTFADDQWEALEMIVHKMARIVNGNPDNHDSWVDIAGYAMLVADRLEGNAR